jgi:dATP pyrophosphohydrolase
MPEIVSRVIDCHVFCRKHITPLYLLMKRADGVVYAGSWRMVGGKIESGEKAYATALRELKEETALAPRRLWSVPYINSFYEAAKDRVNIIPVFAAEVDTMSVTLSAEHGEYQWVPYADAKTLLPWPAQIEGLRIVHEFIVGQKLVAEFVEIKL